jgi:hypothetical protein
MKHCALWATLGAFLLADLAMADHAKRDVVANCAADNKGNIDATQAIQNCIDQVGNYGAVYFPPGRYKVTGTLSVSKASVYLQGDSPDTAVIMFSGCGTGSTAIRFSAGTGLLTGGGVRNLALAGIGSCTKTAIDLQDTSAVNIKDVNIYDFTDSTENSVGIRTEGRELLHVQGVYIRANNPIMIGRNTNTSGGSNYLDADHFHFHDVYTAIPTSINSHYHITVSSNVTVTSTTFDQAFAAAGGCGFFKWISTTAPVSVSSHLRLAGFRHEQRQPSTCDKIVDIELPSGSPLQQLIVENGDFGEYVPGGWNGGFPANLVYTSNVDSITVADSSYGPGSGSNFLNVNNAKWLELRNNYISVFAFVQMPGLAWKTVARNGVDTGSDPKPDAYRGKDCCVFGARTPDTGIAARY